MSGQCFCGPRALDAFHIRLSLRFLLESRPSRDCNLTHDEAFDVDAALQLKLVLGIPAQLQPAGSTFSRRTDTLPAQSTDKRLCVCMGGEIVGRLIVFVPQFGKSRCNLLRTGEAAVGVIFIFFSFFFPPACLCTSMGSPCINSYFLKIPLILPRNHNLF